MTAIHSLLDSFPKEREHLLHALIALQDSSGTNSLSQDALTLAAEHFRLTRAEVFGVAGYYSMFSTEARGKHLIRVCRSPVCRMMGSRDLLELAGSILGTAPGEISSDGMFTLEVCECLGNCHEAPSVMMDDKVIGVKDEAALRRLIQDIRDGGENDG
jgi:NADH:ubiquinone oxidoreductase subunit E